MNWWEKIKFEFNKGDSPVRKLLFINIGVFVFTLLLGAVAHLYNTTAQSVLVYFELPSWGSEFFKRPWTLFTYMFLHAGFWHLAFNMLLLYYVGRIGEDFMSKARFFTIYIGGGLLGGLLYLIAYNTFPAFTQMESWVPMLGASGAVVAVVVATATLVPNYEVFLYGVVRLKLVWFALILVLMDIAFFPNGNEGGRIAHMGGALFGFAYIRYIQGRLGIGSDLIERVKRLFRPKYQVIDERELRKNSNSKDKKGESTGKPNQSEIDSILDKINQSGYSSLSQEEKNKLFKASQ